MNVADYISELPSKNLLRIKLSKSVEEIAKKI